MEMLFYIGIIAVWIITIRIASKKGRSWFLWMIYGLFLTPIAFIHALCLKDEHKVDNWEAYEKGLIQCPSCLEWVKLGAKVCRYCHSPIPEDTKTPAEQLREQGYGITMPKKPQDNQQ